MLSNRVFFVSILVGITLLSCNSDVIYKGNITYDSGWHKDSAAVFDVALNDTSLVMDFILTFSHTEDYSFRNLWLFNSVADAENNILQTDTIELYIASSNGQWFGRKKGDVYRVSTYYKNNVKMSSQGNYRFTFQQGMRVDNLEDIREVAFEIIRKESRTKNQESRP